MNRIDHADLFVGVPPLNILAVAGHCRPKMTVSGLLISWAAPFARVANRQSRLPTEVRRLGG
jgi:hypothetical protein